MAAAGALAVDAAQEMIDLAFPVMGRRLAADHGYALYGAISQRLPALHGVGWLGIHPLRGPQMAPGVIQLPPRARLVLRLPVVHIPLALGLGGALLRVKGEPLQVGAPQAHALMPSASLDARLVLIKLTEPAKSAAGNLVKAEMMVRFQQELGRQLAALAAEAEVQLLGRQELRVGGKRLLGWTVRLRGLSDEASLRVQARGLGGKRVMGCGLFVPTLERQG